MTNFTVKDGVVQKRTGYAENAGDTFAVTTTPSVTVSASPSATPSPTTTGTPSATTTGTGTPSPTITATPTTTGTPTASVSAGGTSDTITASATSSASVTASITASVTPTESITASVTASDTGTATPTATVSATYSASPTSSASASEPASAAMFHHGHHYQDGVSGNKRFWMFGEAIRYKDGIGGDWYDGRGTCSLLTSGIEDYTTNTTEIVELDDYKNYLIVCQADTRRVGGTFKTIAYTSAPHEPLKNLAGGDGYNGSGTAHFAKSVMNFDNHLLLLHTREHLGGAWRDMFQRVRWSDQSAFTATADWNDVATDGAGYEDLKTDYGSIVNGDILLNNASIYLQEAIFAGYSTGVSDAPFHFEPKVTKTGLFAPRLLANNGRSHFFVGTDEEIYQYWGGVDPQPIGGKIRTEFFTNLNRAANGNYLVRDRSWSFVLRDIKAVIFAIPTGSGNTGPTLFYVYFWDEQRWEKWDYLDIIYGMGNYERPIGETASNMPLFSDDVGNMFQIDYSSTNDDVTAISSNIHTKDFIIDLKNEYRCMEIWFEASGNGAASSVDVDISVDSGVTFKTAQTQTKTIGTGWGVHHAKFNVSGYLARFKFTNNTAGQKLLLGSIRTEITDNNPIR
jgi:hypothetical protein